MLFPFFTILASKLASFNTNNFGVKIQLMMLAICAIVRCGLLNGKYYFI
jgi:hypothetical protein